MAGNHDDDYWSSKKRLENARADVDGKHADSKRAQRELEEAEKEARARGIH